MKKHDKVILQKHHQKVRTIPFRRVRHAKLSPSDFDRCCSVCGMRAINYNYGIISCESCKMFFRRNSWKMNELICLRGKLGKCVIEPSNRRNCTACRLKKCLDLGMKRQLNSFDKKYREASQTEVSKMERIEKSLSLVSEPPCHQLCPPSSSSFSPLSSCSTQVLLSPSVLLNSSYLDLRCDKHDKAAMSSFRFPLSQSTPSTYTEESDKSLFDVPLLPSREKHLSETLPLDTSVSRTNSFLGEWNTCKRSECLNPHTIDHSSFSPVVATTSDSVSNMEKALLLPLVKDVQLVFPLPPSIKSLQCGDYFLNIMLEFVVFDNTDPSHQVYQLELSESEMLNICEVENVFLEFQKQPYSTTMREFLDSPTYERMNLCQEERARRAVLFYRQIYPFPELSLEYQKLIMVTRIPIVGMYLTIANFDFKSRSVRMQIVDGTSSEYVGNKFDSTFPTAFTLLSTYYEFMQHMAKILGPTRRLQALFCCLKIFEVHFHHHHILPKELFKVCEDSFRLYATLLYKAMRAEIVVRHTFKERWIALCHLYAWSRHAFDSQMLEIMSSISYVDSPTCQLMQEVSTAVQNLHNTY